MSGIAVIVARGVARDMVCSGCNGSRTTIISLIPSCSLVTSIAVGSRGSTMLACNCLAVTCTGPVTVALH